ncbi:MAG: hypothetical protein HXS50_04220, partial [Theionarchaea archaeon]|nr:hypothetical protein [Theionarchaea archaeon]
DGNGNFLGYGGKEEKFGDEVVGSTADKSENYGVEEFRRQFALSRMVCDKYIWIYCHGSTFWELDDDEMDRYGGSRSDALPTVDNLDEYIEVLRGRQILADPSIANMASRIREKRWVDFIEGTGSPRRWYLAGPFNNEDNVGFDTSYQPEVNIDPNDKYDGKGGQVGWQKTDVSSSGYVDLSHIFRPPDYSLAYALCYMESERATKGKILMGSDDGVKVWLGNALVHELDVVRGAEPADDVVPIDIDAGRTAILLKVCNHRGSWGFYFRIVGEDYKAIPGVTFTTDPA